MRARGAHLNANYDILLVRSYNAAHLHQVAVLWVKFNNPSNNNKNPTTPTILINANVHHVNQKAYRVNVLRCKAFLFKAMVTQTILLNKKKSTYLWLSENVFLTTKKYQLFISLKDH